MPAPGDHFVALPDRRATGRQLRLHYGAWSEEGRPLLLLHGLASNARIWDLTAPHLTSRFRVIALDQRGHGLSDKPDDGYDFSSITADLAAFIEALGLTRPVIVGHSWGASVALQYAADRPERVGGVALVDGGFIEVSRWLTWEQVEKEMAPLPLDGVPLDVFLSGARSWPDLADIWSAQVEAIVLANFDVDDKRSIHPRLKRENHMRILRALYDQRPSQLYPRVRCPVLIVPALKRPKSERERRWQARGRQGLKVARGRLGQVQVLAMEDTIHDVPLQRPQELANMIAEFAARLP